MAEQEFLTFPTGQVPCFKLRPPRGPHDPFKTGYLMNNQKPLPPGTLPECFRLIIRDAAMEPALQVGDYGIFSTLDFPSPGDIVLMGTTFGPEIRMLDYDNAPGSPWAGCAFNHPSYEHIDGGAEEVWWMATLVGIDPAAKDSAA